MMELTHLAVAILSFTARTHKRIEPRFHAAAHDGVQALVWGLVATKQVENMQLGREGGGRIQSGTPLDEGEGRNTHNFRPLHRSLDLPKPFHTTLTGR